MYRSCPKHGHSVAFGSFCPICREELELKKRELDLKKRELDLKKRELDLKEKEENENT